jgi:hypothetical protein
MLCCVYDLSEAAKRGGYWRIGNKREESFVAEQSKNKKRKTHSHTFHKKPGVAFGVTSRVWIREKTT